MKLVALAQGQLAEPGQSIDLQQVFCGKRFLVLMGWAKRPDARSRRYRDDNMLRGPKYAGDFVRCHDLLELIDT